MSQLIQVEVIENVAVVTMNRPQVMNSLNIPMLKELSEAFQKLSSSSEVRCIVLTGAGRAFSAGIDLTDAGSVFSNGGLAPENDPIAQMSKCTIPIIGAVNGYAFTGGFELALACDILVASKKAVFGDTHAKFGIAPSWGLSQKLSRLVGANIARDISLTAVPFNAERAAAWGLVSRVFEEKDLLSEAIKMAQAVATNHPSLTKRYKATINEGLRLNLGDALEMEKTSAAEYYRSMTPEEFQKMKEFIASRSAAKEKPAPVQQQPTPAPAPVVPSAASSTPLSGGRRAVPTKPWERKKPMTSTPQPNAQPRSRL